LYIHISKQKCQAGKEKFSGVAFITLNLKGKNNLPTLTNLPVVKLAQHPVKNGESYLNITHE